MPHFDALQLHPPPAWAQEGALIYCAMVVVVSMFAGKAAGMVLLGGLAVGVGPLAALWMPRVALAVGLLVAYLAVRRYGWRWLLATLSFVGILGLLAVRNLEQLGPAGLASPPLVLGGLVDAVISAIILWALLVIGWALMMLFGGKFLLLVRSGLAGERLHRQRLAEVKLAKQGRTRAWQQGLKWVTGGRYQPPQPKGKGGKGKPGASGTRTVPTSRPPASGPSGPSGPGRKASPNGPRPGGMPYPRRPAAQRARARRSRAGRNARP